MPTPPLPREELQRTIDTWAACGRRRGEAAEKLGIPYSSLGRRLAICRREGITPSVAPLKYVKAKAAVSAPQRAPTPADLVPEIAPVSDESLLLSIREALRKPQTLAELAAGLSISKGRALDAVESLQRHGLNLHEIDGRWSIEARVPPPAQTDAYHSRPDGRFVFGAVGDSHLGSKYERLDALNDLYDRFAAAGVDRVFHAGNWIDGETSFNRFDLHVYGLEPQLRYMADHYPKRPGIHTFAVAGEDHEGWYSRREAVDIGRFAERVMREAGRDDWHNLGFMEAFVPMVNANSGASAQLLVMHPGGGSAYALSYRPQKILESLEGGEKPAIVLIGHYHKLSVDLIRNVWALQVGCTQDQTPFARKKNLDYHVGGMIVDAEQDTETGAIVGCKIEIVRYFNRGFYNNRWSASDGVTLPERRANGRR